MTWFFSVLAVAAAGWLIWKVRQRIAELADVRLGDDGDIYGGSPETEELSLTNQPVPAAAAKPQPKRPPLEAAPRSKLRSRS